MDYLFFLCGFNNLSNEKVEYIFKEGLPSRTNNIAKTMMLVDATNDDIVYKSGECRFDNVFVVKIPKIFYSSRDSDDVDRDISLPIWKKDGGMYYLSNELIYGMYDQKTGEFTYNDNFKELHNPVGLIYDEHQEKNFIDNKQEAWIRFSRYRRMRDYKTLARIDVSMKTWDNLLVHYNRYSIVK